ncbi:MAG: alpha-hydroxy-acid oxidizing protein [Chloroflexi bacterium]|nr:alpha-hydroxy-acid oxidizing protein [Chloroflexota bacterium]
MSTDLPDLAAIHSLADFEELARARLPVDAFDYVAGGSWDELTLAENERAFQRRRLRPRVLIDVSRIELATTMLGTRVAMPVALAPTAFESFVHPEAELAPARAAAAAGVLFTLSTFSSASLEEVAAVGQGPRWFQLYVHRDRAISRGIVERAAAAGYEAIVLTVDLPLPGYRIRDLRSRLRHPDRLGNMAVTPVPGMAFQDVFAGFTEPALTWSDLAWIRGLTALPLVVKGIMTGEDAALAVDHGAAAIVVSNHGGRQLDRVFATIDVLEEVVNAVAGRVEVYLDGGVRRATDVLTALALGARAVFIGRPYLFAMAAAGEAGVARALELLRTELLTAMPLLGVRTPAEVTRRHAG